MTELVHAPTIVDDKQNTGGNVARGNDGVDPQWMRENSERVREEWGAARRAMTDDMRALRRQLPLASRVDQAITRLCGLSNLPAHRVTIGGRGTADSLGGGRPPGESSTELDVEVRVFIAALESLEKALDVEQGLAPEGSAHLMATSDKDRELFTVLVGVPAEAVARDHRHQGSKATVYRRRKAAGFDAKGRDPETGLAPTPARVSRALVDLSNEGRRVSL